MAGWQVVWVYGFWSVKSSSVSFFAYSIVSGRKPIKPILSRMPHACALFGIGVVVGYVLKTIVSDIKKALADRRLE